MHNEGLESDEAIIQAAKDVGIRLVLARTMYDWDGAPSGYVETVDEAVKNVKYLAAKYQADEMVSIVPAPHSLHAASAEMVRAGHRLARELDTKFHIHVAEEPFEVEQVQRETGMRPVEWLKHIGVMEDGRMAAIHCVWLNENEKNIMAENQAKLIYCPSSNMFLSDGITDIPALMKKGVNIGLGSDGACSNNRISVFEEMRMCALLQKVHTLDSLAVTIQDVFKMGTSQGAEILDIPAGEIKIGYLADFVLLKMNDFSMQPISGSAEQILPNIVYSLQPSAISKVVVNGEERVRDGAVLSLPEGETIQKVVQLMNRLEKEALNKTNH
ncbi:amidohydrolase family protein [Terrilactibacillus sp. S3-3]|nr:amidohydrolase family protein [Terrilactibacillus sp. S3-3]